VPQVVGPGRWLITTSSIPPAIDVLSIGRISIYGLPAGAYKWVMEHIIELTDEQRAKIIQEKRLVAAKKGGEKYRDWVLNNPEEFAERHRKMMEGRARSRERVKKLLEAAKDLAS